MDEQTVLNQRGKDLLYEAFEFFRKEIQKDFSDWKSADDWLFSNLDITIGELEQVYNGRTPILNGQVYGGSCREG